MCRHIYLGAMSIVLPCNIGLSEQILLKSIPLKLLWSAVVKEIDAHQLFQCPGNVLTERYQTKARKQLYSVIRWIVFIIWTSKIVSTIVYVRLALLYIWTVKEENHCMQRVFHFIKLIVYFACIEWWQFLILSAREQTHNDIVFKEISVFFCFFFYLKWYICISPSI